MQLNVSQQGRQCHPVFDEFFVYDHGQLALETRTDYSVQYELARRLQGGQKTGTFFLYASTSTSSNIDRFSNLFHFLNHENICHNTTTKDPTTPQVCRYTTLWNVSGLKATIKNNTTSVTQHFRKINNRNQHVYCLKVTFASHSANFTSNHSNVQCVRLVAGRRTLKMCYYRRHLVFNCCF